MNPHCEGEVTLTVLPECPACAEPVESSELKIEYGPPIIGPCLEALRDQQSISEYIAQRYCIPFTLADAASQSNYAGTQLHRDILDRQLGIEPEGPSHDRA